MSDQTWVKKVKWPIIWSGGTTISLCVCTTVEKQETTPEIQLLRYSSPQRKKWRRSARFM